MSDVETSKALADAIEQRRRALGYRTITSLVSAAGVTAEGIRPLRRGEIRNYQERMTDPLCKALRWTPDSIDRILRGEPPVELPDEIPATPTVDLGERVARQERAHEMLVQRFERALDQWETERNELADAVERLNRRVTGG